MTIPPTEPYRVILLGGYAAKQCPVRTHNDFAPLVPTLIWEPPAEIQADLDAGRAFEDEIFAGLLGIHGNAATLVDPRLRKAEAVGATLAAHHWFRLLFGTRIALVMGLALAVNWAWVRAGLVALLPLGRLRRFLPPTKALP